MSNSNSNSKHFLVTGLIFLGIVWEPNKANSAAALYFSISALLGTGFLRAQSSLPDIIRYLSYGTGFKYASEILVLFLRDYSLS